MDDAAVTTFFADAITAFRFVAHKGRKGLGVKGELGQWKCCGNGWKSAIDPSQQMARWKSCGKHLLAGLYIENPPKHHHHRHHHRRHRRLSFVVLCREEFGTLVALFGWKHGTRKCKPPATALFCCLCMLSSVRTSVCVCLWSTRNATN